MLINLYGGTESSWYRELTIYWNDGCWGNSMEGITPERGVWMTQDHDKTPVRLYPTMAALGS